jgi:hypothetical protein
MLKDRLWHQKHSEKPIMVSPLFCYALIVAEIMTHVLFTMNAALFCILTQPPYVVPA